MYTAVSDNLCRNSCINRRAIPHFIKMNCERLQQNFKVYWRNRVAKSSSYTVLLGSFLHERGFKSSRFHALETASKTKRFQSVYKVPISPFSSAYVMPISFPGTIIEEGDLGSIIT